MGYDTRNESRRCPWCRGTGSQTDRYHAPQRWACPDCDGTGRQQWCENCGEWHGPHEVCEEVPDDLVADGGNDRLDGQEGSGE